MSICKIYFYFFVTLCMNLFALSIFFMVLDKILILDFSLLSLNSCSLEMVVLLDWMSMLFMSFVLFISSMVILYSEEYMESEVYLHRFILLVVAFVLSMMLLIISPNLISILLGWDGLGLVSYCLVIYYQNEKSYNAGMLTALTNRIGDVMLLMSIAWMLNFGSWNYIYYLEFMKNDMNMQIISYMVIIASMTKSAQIPFSSWLPSAMAAPTPVSSLVHSSTLVTAGVYLLIRFNLSFNSSMMYFLLFFACLTMFMSGLGANFEFDLKKIIALSTLSQLGLMMSILALGEYKLAFFHLLTHALFKALLFMCAGNIIHNMNNTQDIRFMGSLVYQMPLTCCFFNISNFSLCGLPFLSGFYSKDMIVEVMSMQYLNLFIYLIFYISVGLTVCYSIRLTYYSLMGAMNFNSLNLISEKSKLMLKGMGGLISFVIFMGSGLSWLMFPSPYFICLPNYMKLMTLFMILLGGIIGYEVSKFKLFYVNKSLNLYYSSLFLSFMWNMPVLSTLGINLYPLNMGQIYVKNFDQGWYEFYGSKSIFNLVLMLLLFFQSLSKNHLKIYFIMMIMWLFFLLVNI